MNTIFSFPGLGIDETTISKVAFSIGDSISVRWYGIFITLGILFCFFYAFWRGKQLGVKDDDIIDIGLLTVFLGIVGSRVYYVLTDSGNTYDSILDVIAIWNGGLAIYGAIIGGVTGIIIMCAVKHVSWRKLFDIAAPAVIFAQAVGRWGNFFNGEAHGYAITETSQFYFFNQVFLIDTSEGTIFNTLRMGLGGVNYYHPTFLYESCWCLLGFILLNVFYKKRKYDGEVAVWYFTWYGFGRMFIEGLRTDSLYITGTSLRVSQCVGLLCFVIGTLIFILGRTAFKNKWTIVPVKEPIMAEATESVDENESTLGLVSENDTEEIDAEEDVSENANNEDENVSETEDITDEITPEAEREPNEIAPDTEVEQNDEN